MIIVLITTIMNLIEKIMSFNLNFNYSFFTYNIIKVVHSVSFIIVFRLALKVMHFSAVLQHKTNFFRRNTYKKPSKKATCKKL